MRKKHYYMNTEFRFADYAMIVACWLTRLSYRLRDAGDRRESALNAAPWGAR